MKLSSPVGPMKDGIARPAKFRANSDNVLTAGADGMVVTGMVRTPLSSSVAPLFWISLPVVLSKRAIALSVADPGPTTSPEPPPPPGAAHVPSARRKLVVPPPDAGARPFAPLVKDLRSKSYFVESAAEYVAIPHLIAEPELLDDARRFMRRKGKECLDEADRLDALFAAVTSNDPDEARARQEVLA